MRKPKIAVFHCAFVYSGGGERIVLEEVFGLRERGYEVDLYAPAIDWEGCFPDLLKKAQPRPVIAELPRWVPLRDALGLGLSSLLAPLVAPKFRSYDIYLGCNQPGAWFAFLYSRIFKKPYVIYLNQPNRMVYPREIDRETGWFINPNFVFLAKITNLFQPLVARLDRISIRGADIMLANGKYIGEVISRIYDKPFIECPAGCDPFPHGKLDIKKEKYYQGEIKIGERKIGKPYILLTNRHYPQKKFDYVIQALPAVLKEYPDVRLVIAGAFTKVTGDWRWLAGKLGVADHIFWLGEVHGAELGALYENAAVYVYTAPEEDFGMGVIEAEEFGVPVVAWKYAGPTVTVRDGVTGFLAQPYRVDDFAEKIVWLLKNPEKRVEMGKKAHEHVRKNFTWKKHVDILEKAILDSLQVQ